MREHQIARSNWNLKGNQAIMGKVKSGLEILSTARLVLLSDSKKLLFMHIYDFLPVCMHTIFVPGAFRTGVTEH